jgi:hypothetical protein
MCGPAEVVDNPLDIRNMWPAGLVIGRRVLPPADAREMVDITRIMA